jgi:hypothetical protein
LVLGGYDSSRIDLKSARTSYNFNDKGAMEVQVFSITVKNNTGIDYSATYGVPSFTAVIDSTLPYLYLPSQVCTNLATALGLQVRTTTGPYQDEIYTLSDSQRMSHYQSDTAITIVLTNSGSNLHPTDPLNRTTITLPYAAVDLNVSWPITNSPSNMTPYFPLLPANDTVILGRAFLQEVGIIADFERGSFTVVNAKFPAPGEPPSITAIPSLSAGAGFESKHLSTGTIVAIAICAFAVVVAILILPSA